MEVLFDCLELKGAAMHIHLRVWNMMGVEIVTLGKMDRLKPSRLNVSCMVTDKR